MKTKNDQTGMTSGNDFGTSGSEVGEDPGNTGTDNKTDNTYLLGSGNRSEMGEVIMRWEASGYII
jgi:hypothetical protein